MIKILTKRGAAHELNSEDNYFLYEKDDLIVGAVFDGCSTGRRSHWTSETFKILFEKNKELLFFDSLKNIDIINVDVNYFLLVLISDLKGLKQNLNLSEFDFLSTIILFLYSKSENTFYCKFLGDGNIFFQIKESKRIYEHINDENNKPNYIAYLLNKPLPYIKNSLALRESFYYRDVERFVISTDGIDSFINQNPNYDYLNIENAKEYLVETPLFEDKVSELGKKYNLLKEDHWVPMDDLTVIKYISDEV